MSQAFSAQSISWAREPSATPQRAEALAEPPRPRLLRLTIPTQASCFNALFTLSQTDSTLTEAMSRTSSSRVP